MIYVFPSTFCTSKTPVALSITLPLLQNNSFKIKKNKKTCLLIQSLCFSFPLSKFLITHFSVSKKLSYWQLKRTKCPSQYKRTRNCIFNIWITTVHKKTCSRHIHSRHLPISFSFLFLFESKCLLWTHKETERQVFVDQQNVNEKKTGIEPEPNISVTQRDWTASVFKINKMWMKRRQGLINHFSGYQQWQSPAVLLVRDNVVRDYFIL